MHANKIILVGGGGHCRSCIDVIEQENKFLIEGIVDTPDKVGSNISGYPILYTDNDLPALAKEYIYFFITVGQIKQADKRINLFRILKSLNVHIPTIISPLAYVSRNASLGEGTIVMHHSLINAGVQIGTNCIVNSKALVEHDSIIGDFCHISTGAIVNGGATIGSNTFIGSNAVVVQGVSIKNNSFIKAGSICK